MRNLLLLKKTNFVKFLIYRFFIFYILALFAKFLLIIFIVVKTLKLFNKLIFYLKLNL